MRRPRLVLADDHTLIVHGLRRMLEPDCEVVGIASDGRSLVDLVQKTHPDLVLLDISMPLLNGIDAARQIRKNWPAIKIAFLTMHADRDYVIEAFRAGASAYLLKSSAEDELLGAIQKVLAGKVYVTNALAPELRTLHLQQREVRGPSESALTEREREVLQLVAEGRSAKEIAGILRLSVKTVEYHKYRMMNRLGLHSSAELVSYAVRKSLLGLAPASEQSPPRQAHHK